MQNVLIEIRIDNNHKISDVSGYENGKLIFHFNIFEKDETGIAGESAISIYPTHKLSIEELKIELSKLIGDDTIKYLLMIMGYGDKK